MKIMICGSMAFSKEFLETKAALESMGHEVLIPSDTAQCVENPDLSMDFDHCSNLDIDKECFDKLAMSDAILVLNYPKNGIKGYVGGATLMEIGLARHLNKKIFFLHDLPSEEDLRYALEIRLTKPVVIDGDISRIK